MPKGCRPFGAALPSQEKQLVKTRDVLGTPRAPARLLVHPDEGRAVRIQGGCGREGKNRSYMCVCACEEQERCDHYDSLGIRIAKVRGWVGKPSSEPCLCPIKMCSEVDLATDCRTAKCGRSKMPEWCILHGLACKDEDSLIFPTSGVMGGKAVSFPSAFIASSCSPRGDCSPSFAALLVSKRTCCLAR